MMRQIIVTAFLLFSIHLFSQEVLVGLGNNPKILNSKIHQTNSKSNVVRTLPFIDDFSSENIFPADSLWQDNMVFINNDYPLYPVSVGVATFDAIDSKGKIYSNAISTAFPADTLTSVKVRLDSCFIGGVLNPVNISDSIYFSFYYQPQGIGNAPEQEDSLLLEFYSDSQSKWYRVWGAGGETIQNFYNTNQQYFKPVIIAITDSLKYFSSNFQFRFRNFASLANNNIPSWAGNVDQWNIDYVYLNRARSFADSVYRSDICFVNRATTLLKNYEAMPWNQYKINPASEMADTLHNLISNLDDATKNTTYKFDVFDETNTSVHAYNGGNANLDTFIPNGYQTYPPHAKPSLDGFAYPSSSGDSASFNVVHVIKDGLLGDELRWNDTVRFNQKFYNYYAYDDGCPEAGYGLTPANSKLAVRFTLGTPDTLRAVDMYFNQTYNDVSQKSFYLTVWSSLSPETIVYEKHGLIPLYEDSLNLFHRYYLDTPVSLSGTFYVGWKQLTADFLNIGFDRNTNSNSAIFYNTSGTWMNTMYSGSLMIRPVLGKALPVGVIENSSMYDGIKTYPNPVTDNQLFFKIQNIESIKDLKEVIIYDFSGRQIYRTKFNQQIILPDLTNGVYYLDVINQQGLPVHKDKLIIIK